MMAQRAALSKAELEIARIVWNLGEVTVRQVLEALPADRGIDHKTVQTYLRRLTAKGRAKSGQKLGKCRVLATSMPGDCGNRGALRISPL